MKEKCKQLQNRFRMEQHQVIRRSAQDANFDTVYEKLKKSIESIIQLDTYASSFSTFVMHAKGSNGLEVDDRRCYYGHMAAESILKDIDEYNKKKPGSAKAQILPCQSDLTSRKEIAGLDKELCRQRQLKEDTIQNYAFDIKEKKWKLQLNQLRKPMSDSFRYFLQCLFSLEATDKKYFLQSLKLGPE